MNTIFFKLIEEDNYSIGLATKVNQKWVTDITEFTLFWEKYL